MAFSLAFTSIVLIPQLVETLLSSCVSADSQKGGCHYFLLTRTFPRGRKIVTQKLLPDGCCKYRILTCTGVPASMCLRNHQASLPHLPPLIQSCLSFYAHFM